MTIQLETYDTAKDKAVRTEPSNQQSVDLRWLSRDKWYEISRVTLTHNPEFPTPAISVIAPQPGIRFTVYNQKGEVVYTNKKNSRQDDPSEA